ncbi:hypothetical protein ACPB9I_24935 [Streptomyces cellulosae]
MWSAGKTGTRAPTAQRSRNPPDTAAFNGAVGGNRRPLGRRGCQLVADDTGTGRLSRLADEIEAVQLGMADDLLGHAVDLLGDTGATALQLRHLAACLAEALHDVHRIARSRGARLHVSDGDEEDADAVPEGGRGN